MSSNDILIATKDGVVIAWAIRKKPVQEQRDAGLIKEMKGTPCKPNPNKAGNFIPVYINFDATEDVEVDGELKPARTEGMPRAVYIKSWMTDTYGFTEDCQGCAAKRAGMRVSKTHSATCRKRIEEEIEKTERGQKAKAKADERWVHWAASEVEKNEARGNHKDTQEEPKAAEYKVRRSQRQQRYQFQKTKMAT